MNFEEAALQDIFAVKRLTLSLRRHVAPEREVFNILTNRPSKLLSPDSQIYFRDIYDHVLRINDSIETFRDLASSVLDSYLTQVSNRLGKITKGLSVIATLSIPFVVMLVFLIGYSFSSKGLRGEEFEIDRRMSVGTHADAPPLPRTRGWRRALGPLVTAVALAALPILFDDVWIFDQYWIGVFTQGLALAIIYLSYTMVTGEGGLISLCQITLAGIGAFALYLREGWEKTPGEVWCAVDGG